LVAISNATVVATLDYLANTLSGICWRYMWVTK